MLKILVVDDNADNRELLVYIFNNEYEVFSVEDGFACLSYCEETKPDLILLDVNMPNLSGFEVCQQLKSNPETSMIPVIFVSALDSPDERLAGYEAGGEDYITKPFDDEVLMEVVTKVLERTRQLASFEQKNKEAMSTAFQAMASSAELGSIIQFLQASFQYTSTDALANGLIDTLAGFGLKACINIRKGYRDDFFACETNSMDAKVLRNFREGERILDFGARSLVNGHNICVLIKNMPLDNPELYGRLKDHLIVLVSGSEARIKVLETEHQLEEERRCGIQSVVLRSHEELKGITQLIKRQEIATQRVTHSLTEKIERIVFSLGLEEDQEQTILSALDVGNEEIRTLTKMTIQVENAINNFIEQLDKLVH